MKYILVKALQKNTRTHHLCRTWYVQSYYTACKTNQYPGYCIIPQTVPYRGVTVYIKVHSKWLQLCIILILIEYSKRSDIPKIFKPGDDESSERRETAESRKSNQSTDAPSSGSGESASSDEAEDTNEASASAKDLESSGVAVKRNVIPTEVFEEGTTVRLLR